MTEPRNVPGCFHALRGLANSGGEFAELAFFVDGADGAVEHIEADDDADGEFAGALGDGDDVGVFAGDGREDAASQAWGAAHAFTDDGE